MNFDTFLFSLQLKLYIKEYESHMNSEEMIPYLGLAQGGTATKCSESIICIQHIAALYTSFTFKISFTGPNNRMSTHIAYIGDATW